MTVKSTVKRPKAKPTKPRPDFPLYAHAVGKWAKTIQGKTFYFGTWDDPQGAEQQYVKFIEQGGSSQTRRSKGLELRELCDRFIRNKRAKMDAGQLSPSTLVDYDQVCRLLIDEFGRTRSVEDLKPEHFQRLYGKLARKHGINTLGTQITMIRSVFKYAYDMELIDRPVRFGPDFRPPNKDAKRKAKAKTERANGKKMFQAHEIRAMLEAADQPLNTMILLGNNCGFGNSDCANLPLSALDLEHGWLEYPRPKTRIDRRIPLWPETVEALREAIASRRKPRDAADADLVFVTKYGQRWVRYEVTEEKVYGRRRIKPKFDDAVAKRFSKLLDELGLKRPGIGFYALRHTFETIAGGCNDQVAVDSIMGHCDPTMAAAYRHGIEDSRLRAVVDHVRGWLYGNE